MIGLGSDNKVFWTKKHLCFGHKKLNCRLKCFPFFIPFLSLNTWEHSFFWSWYLDGMMLDLFLSRLVVLPKKASNCAGRCFSCLSKQRQKKPSHHANQEGAGIETQHVQQLLNTSRNTTCPTTYKQLFSQPWPCFFPNLEKLKHSICVHFIFE